MMSCLGMADAMNSIEQQASPNWNLHSEYFRLQVAKNGPDLGADQLVQAEGSGDEEEHHAREEGEGQILTEVSLRHRVHHPSSPCGLQGTTTAGKSPASTNPAGGRLVRDERPASEECCRPGPPLESLVGRTWQSIRLVF